MAAVDLTRHLSPGGMIALAAAVLLVPLPWILAAAAAAAFHELCHLAAIYLLGGNASYFRLNGRGAFLEVNGLSPAAELAAAGAGPAGSILLGLIFLHHLPRVAVCGWIQGLYNLLPVYPLDGGRIMRGSLSAIMGPESGKRWADRIEKTALAGILLLGSFYSFYPRFQPMAGILSVFLVLRAKNPCQDSGKAVQ